MPAAEHIVDSCSLINLHSGWGGLAELRAIGGNWHVCEAVLEESEYAREYGLDGVPTIVELNLPALVSDGLLAEVRAESEQELEDYVVFASEIDDGEAQALAIAKSRGYVLLTDDRKALKIANREDVGVRTICTATVLQRWAGLSPENEGRLPSIIARIEDLGRFRPHKDSSDYKWWLGLTCPL
jgi:predicted nucleic acid-binding protein